MTRRERLERKAELRREWAAKRATRATASFDAARRETAGIPMGQPILVGHHSESRHRNALKRSDSKMRRGLESSDMAVHHASKADGIESQLENSIFSDDTDAIEQLQARIDEREAERDRMKAINKAIKTAFKTAGMTLEVFAAGDWLQPGLSTAELRELLSLRRCWGRAYAPGFPPYELTNLGAKIRADKKRMEEVKRRATRSKQAEDSAGGVCIEGADYISVIFADKPDRSILNELRAADFRWGGGSWSGYRSKLPASVMDLVETA